MTVKTPHIVHRLTTTDPSLARGLLQMFADAFEEPGTYLGAIPSSAYFQNLLAKEQVIVLAALADEAVVGGLVAYEFEKLEQERSEIYIYDLPVATTHRRQGIATALIGEVQQIAVASGAHVIFVQADQGDDPAIALYESLGLREEVLHFDIEPAAKGSSA